jgi:hypothetical protein
LEPFFIFDSRLSLANQSCFLMRLLVKLTLCLLLALVVPFSVAIAAPVAGWQKALSSAHSAALTKTEGRLDDLAYWRDLAEQEMAASEAPKPGDALFGALVAKPGLPIAAADVMGAWKCRTVRVENNGLTVFPFFNCRIARMKTGLWFEKLDGSRVFEGSLYPRDTTSMVLLSSWREAKQKKLAYGSKAESSDVGFLFKTSAKTLRLEFPNNSLSMYDIVELVRVK